MKYRKQLYFGLLLATLLLITGCTDKTFTIEYTEEQNCIALADALDEHVSSNGVLSIRADHCLNQPVDPVIVGGTLIEIIPNYYNHEENGVTVYDSGIYKLTFKGNQKTGYFVYSTIENITLPYEIGKFYKFDIARKCLTQYSMQLSGLFSDHELNRIKNIDCN